MTYELKHDDVVRELRALAAERPDFNYQESDDYNGSGIGLACKYHIGGQPSCIVGHVVHRLLPQVLPELENGMAGFALPEHGIALDENTKVLLNEVQYKQDTGTPWGEAVEHALGIAEHIG